MKDQTIRVKRKSNGFVMIDNSVFSDARLSFKAKGILGYILSKPKDWKVRVEDLYNQSTDGYTAIRSGITELILTGYMELRTKYDPDGEIFKGRRYYLYEEPLFKEGFRLLANKNKNLTKEESIVKDNPLGNNRGL